MRSLPMKTLLMTSLYLMTLPVASYAVPPANFTAICAYDPAHLTHAVPVVSINEPAGTVTFGWSAYTAPGQGPTAETEVGTFQGIFTPESITFDVPKDNIVQHFTYYRNDILRAETFLRGDEGNTARLRVYRWTCVVKNNV